MRDYRIHCLVLLAISLGCASGAVALAQTSPLQVTGSETLHDGLSPDKTSNLLNHPTLAAGNTTV